MGKERTAALVTTENVERMTGKVWNFMMVCLSLSLG